MPEDTHNKAIYGVLGYPAKHSLSPAMHNAAFTHLNINAEYKLFEVKSEELDLFFSNLVQGKKDIRGLNVTLPYKEKALEFVKLKSDSLYLKKVGAVNTIVSEEGAYYGYNTDIYGFLQHLQEYIQPKVKRVAILGAGGASRAVSYALAKAGAQEIVIFDIDAGKAAKVVEMIKEIFPLFAISNVASVKAVAIEDKDILINATPVGLRDNEPSVVAEEFLRQGLFVYDLIYNPEETKLLKLAKAKGCGYTNGLGMLLYQGALSFKLFTGQEAPLEVMRKALKEGVDKL